MDKLRENKVIIIILIIGVAVAVYSWRSLQGKINDVNTTTKVIAASADIEAYSTIQADDIKEVSVASSAVDKYTVLDSSKVVGKITKVKIYSDKPLDSRVLSDDGGNMGDKRVVGVYVNPARCAGVNDGDLVDVYWIRKTNTIQSSVPIASNARVLTVADEKGAAIKGGVVEAQVLPGSTGLTHPPKIVYLVVSPQEVPYVITGGSEDGGVALAKKFKEDTAVGELEQGKKGLGYNEKQSTKYSKQS